jgi:hypothetical protein
VIVVVVIAAAIALAWVMAPLRRPEADVADARTLTEEADARRRAALAAIVDLEDDRSVGKLAEEDFDALKDQYDAEALAAMAELDALGASTAEPDELEAEIAAMRRAMTCSNCGATKAPGEACPRCGAP